MALLRGFCVPAQCLLIILLNTLAVAVHKAHIKLCVCIALLRGFCVPAQCLLIILVLTAM